MMCQLDLCLNCSLLRSVIRKFEIKRSNGTTCFVLDIFEVIVALNSQIRTNFITKRNKILGLNEDLSDV